MTQPSIRILIIDDDQDICLALKAIFEFQGWQVTCANRVRDGLRLLQNSRFHIVIIDYHMPEINGVQGVRLIREILPRIPILVLTIDNNQEIADQFLAAGANDFALKPIKAPDIISRIKLHIRLMRTAPKEEETVKGIVNSTLVLIRSHLKKQSDFITADDLAQELGMAYPTVYRYLKHLIDRNEVEVQTAYGKVGRPKQSYRLIQ